MSRDKSSPGEGWPEGLPSHAAAFLQETIDQSLMRYDVLLFFYRNPYAILTISDLSVWMSREERPLSDALQQLAALGYLDQSPASAAFVLTADRAKRDELNAFFDYVEETPDLSRQIRVGLRRLVGGERS